MKTQELVGYYYNGHSTGVSRRAFLRASASVPVMILTLGAGKCSRAEVDRQARLLLSTIRSAIPTVRSFAPAIAAKLELILPIVEKLRVAIEANDQTNAVLYLRELLPTFVDIVEHDVPSLPEAFRTKALIALAVADIALNFIASFYEQNAPSSVRTKGRDVISEFARKPVWGHQYAN